MEDDRRRHPARIVTTLHCAVGLLATACARSALRPGDDSETAPADGGGAAAPDGSTPPRTILFRLRFISDISESIYVDETDPAWLNVGHWLRIRQGGTAIRKAPACELCRCDDCPNCPICGAPCDTVTEIAAPGQVEWLWSGLTYPESTCPAEPSDRCLDEVPAAAGSYTAEFCWGLSFEGTLPCPALIPSGICAEVPFTYPDEDGVVEHLVNNGG